MLNKSKELNNMKKKKATRKMIDDAHRAWSILSSLQGECHARGVGLRRDTELYNFLNTTLSSVVMDLEDAAND